MLVLFGENPKTRDQYLVVPLSKVGLRMVSCCVLWLGAELVPRLLMEFGGELGSSISHDCIREAHPTTKLEHTFRD